MTPAYRFGSFELCQTRRQLLKDGREVALIPRYFDLLVLLVERRREAVHRREIHSRVWSDVVVTDGAVSQGVRILRKVLGDDPKEPMFIRTVSRHGYQFVFPGVEEVSESGVQTAAASAPTLPNASSERQRSEAIEAALAVLLEPESGENGADRRRDAAETLHALGTTESLRRLDARSGHQAARALLRDARWDVAGAGEVPILGTPGALITMALLIRMRLRRALAVASQRWASAAGGGALAGLVSGAMGGLILEWGPGSTAGAGVPMVLACFGAVVGGLGAAGVGAGIEIGEVVARSSRQMAVVGLGALGGGLVGAAAHGMARLALEGIFGRDFSPLAGGLEGLALGMGAAFGYALSSPRPGGGLAAPTGRARLATILATGVGCALAGLLLAARGRFLGAMSLDLLAHSFPGSQVGLEPLARLLGEAQAGAITRHVVSAGEGLMFGAGLAWGVTRRPH